MLTDLWPAHSNFRRANDIYTLLVSYQRFRKKEAHYRPRTLAAQPCCSIGYFVAITPYHSGTFAIGGLVSVDVVDCQPALPVWVLRALDNLCPLACRKPAMHSCVRV
jgi:hypothetical protein